MKALLLFALIFISVNLSAQFIGNPHVGLIPVTFGYDNFRSGNSMTVNYDQSDELVFGANYQRALFPIHRKYAGDTNQRIVYAVYTLDFLITTDNSYILPFANVNNLVLDSMDFQLGHVNHSGANDTIIFTLIGLDVNTYPNGSSVLVDTVILSAALSPSNNINNTISFRWAPDYLMGNQPIGLKIEFTGSLQDSLALMSGYGIYPAPNSCIDESLDKARQSFFYANSYAYWSNFNLLLPTAAGGDLSYNCDTLITVDTSDSKSYIQNWSISSYVSAPQIGLEETPDAHLTIYPLPANNILYLKGVENISTVSVFNSSGSCIKTFTKPASLDVSDLLNGIYIFAITYDNRTIHKKVVIQH